MLGFGPIKQLELKEGIRVILLGFSEGGSDKLLWGIYGFMG